MKSIAAGLLLFTALTSPVLSKGASSSGGYSHSSPSISRSSPSVSRPSGGGFSSFGFGAGGDSAVTRALGGSSYRSATTPSAPPSVTMTSPSSPIPSTTHSYSSWRSPTTSRRYVPSTVIIHSPAYSNPSWTNYWIMLEAMDALDRERYDREHRDDAEYQRWRAQAHDLAQSDPTLRAKLDGKDPEGSLAPVQLSVANPESHAGLYTVITVIILAGGVGFFIILNRAAKKRLDEVKAKDMVPIERRTDLTDVAEEAKLRVGQVIGTDPTYFILYGNSHTAVPSDTERSITKLTAVNYFGTAHQRAWISDTKRFEVHYGYAGIDQCRYFNQIDQVVPTDVDEWSFWIDDEDGAIGDSTFKDKDGEVYSRAWAPSDKHIGPGKPERMLYVNDKGTEYILLEVVEENRVEIWSGIDVRPESLNVV